MRAMVLEAVPGRLVMREREIPEPGPGQVLLRVTACGVCRTDVHLADAELPDPKLPLIPGHQIVGRVERVDPSLGRLRPGDRVGVPWLGWTCGECLYCRSGKENLCDEARFTGYQLDGGFAEYAVADERFCFAIPPDYDDVHVAPLLCAGMIGYRAYRLTENGERLGLYGFGSAAHLLLQLAVADGRKVFAFTRPGDEEGQRFARELGAEWAGASDERPDEPLDDAIIFAPVGGLVPAALEAVRKGGTVVCAGIHMSDIPDFPYRLLWGERTVRSVANLTRVDGEELFNAAWRVPLRVETTPFPLEAANEALEAIRNGTLKGSAVLSVSR